jgi:hypothetical protein
MMISRGFLPVSLRVQARAKARPSGARTAATLTVPRALVAELVDALG